MTVRSILLWHQPVITSCVCVPMLGMIWYLLYDATITPIWLICRIHAILLSLCLLYRTLSRRALPFLPSPATISSWFPSSVVSQTLSSPKLPSTPLSSSRRDGARRRALAASNTPPHIIWCTKRIHDIYRIFDGVNRRGDPRITLQVGLALIILAILGRLADDLSLLFVGILLTFMVPVLLLNERLPLYRLVKRWPPSAILQAQISDLLDWASYIPPQPAASPASSSAATGPATPSLATSSMTMATTTGPSMPTIAERSSMVAS